MKVRWLVRLLIAFVLLHSFNFATAQSIVLSYSTFLPPPPGNETTAFLSVDSSGTACVSDGTTLWTYDANGNPTVTVQNIASATGITLDQLGGSLLGPAPSGGAIFRDGQGNCYVAGPLASASQGGVTFGHAIGGIAKFSPTGTLLYSSYFGGTPDPGLVLTVSGLTVDSSGNVFVTGTTNFPDFPLKNPIQNILEGTQSAYLLKLSSDGSTLIYSTFFGNATQGNAVTVDSSGDALITGVLGTISTTTGVLQPSPLQVGAPWVAEVNSTGALVYATYLSGSNGSGDSENAIAVNASGNAYVAGQACSSDFPTTPGAFQTALGNGECNGAISELSPDGTTLVYSTYVGISDFLFNQIALDSNGTAYLTGTERIAEPFLLVNPLQSDNLAGIHGEYIGITAVNNTGTGLLYSSLFGGIGQESPSSIGVDSTGDTYVAGSTGLTAFPVLNANNGLLLPFFQLQGLGNPTRGFLAKISPGTGTALASVTAVDFGLQPLSAGSTASVDVLFLDAGTTDIPVGNVAITGDFSISANTCSGTVASSKTCTASVVFTPTTGGRRTGTLTLNSTALSSPQIIQLTGVGGVPNVSLNVSSLNLASSGIGTQGPSQTVVLTNNGTDVLNITSIGVVGAFSADFIETQNCSSPLGVNQPCQIQVSYKPSTPSTETAQLQITDNAAGSPQTVSLNGIIVTTQVTLGSSLNPSPVDGAVTFNALVQISAEGLLGAGTVTFNDGSTALGTANLVLEPLGTSGTASLTVSNLAAGTHSISATYSGPPPVTSNVVMQQVVTGAPGVAFTATSPTQVSINAGNTATYNFSLTSTLGFSGTVTFSCSGVPANATCGVTPSPAQVPPPFCSSSCTTAIAATVATTSRASTLLPITWREQPIPNMIFVATISTLLLGVLMFVTGKRSRVGLLVAASLLSIIGMAAGCGGSSSGSVHGTPAGNYTITITATAGTSTQSTNVTLQVN